jgi:hypothetical protein
MNEGILCVGKEQRMVHAVTARFCLYGFSLGLVSQIDLIDCHIQQLMRFWKIKEFGLLLRRH